MRIYNRCAALKCRNNTNNCSLSFFRFPTDINRARIWLIACSRNDLMQDVVKLHTLSHRLCAIHFEQTMFANDQRNRLLKHAVPRIFPALEGGSSSVAPTTQLRCETSEFLADVSQESQGLEPQHSKHVVNKLTETSLLSSPKARMTQTSASLSANSPRKRKLGTTLKRLRDENYRLKKRLKILQDRKSDSYLDKVTLSDYKQLTNKFCPSKDIANFINIQVGEIVKKPKGRRFTSEFKQYCLSLYFLGPKLYKKQQLSNNFCLPGIGTLQKFISNINFSVGINSLLFKILKDNAERFEVLDKLCFIFVDEMNCKANLFYNINSDRVYGLEDMGDENRSFKPALAATVVMARGICTNWKQPLAYYLVNSTCPGLQLKKLILNIIQEVTNVGLQVVGVACDMGSNNLQLAKLLDVSPEHPYFMFGNDKIVFLFDIPHLLKALRNNLIKHNFKINDAVASWEYVKQFYSHDKSYNIRGVPKLTDSHIFPNSFEKMKVKLAAQVFSASVAHSMYLYIRFNALSSAATATADLILRINNLFDILNTSGGPAATKYQEVFVGNVEQTDFLKECLTFFNNMEVFNADGVNVTKKIKCILGWKITINGILHLWENLQHCNMTFLLTRRTHQDCLEKFFGSVRQQCGNNVNPTPIQFIRAFRKLLCLDLLHSGTENCEDDTSRVLLKMTDMPQNVEDRCELAVPSETLIVDTDYRKSDILEKNFVKYVCGYLVKKCLVRHTCDTCVQYANANSTIVDETSLFCFYKAYRHTDLDQYGSLYMPHTNFINFITALEILFQKNFEKLTVMDNLVFKIVNIFKTVTFIHPCTNFPLTYLLNLYARVRTYYTLKYANRNFKVAQRNRKLII